MNRLKQIAICTLALFAFSANAANVDWNHAVVDDFSSWQPGAWLISGALPFQTCLGILGNGDIWESASANYSSGGAYWVYSFFGDELAKFEDYLDRELAIDLEYTQTGKTIVGSNYYGHEDRAHNGHTYLAIIGWEDRGWEETAYRQYYWWWVELDGKECIQSAGSLDGPLRIGTGEIIPEPTSALLLLIGAAALSLRRPSRSTSLFL